MTIPTITTPPPAPQRSDPATFSARSDAWLTYIEADMVPDINAMATEVNATVDTINITATAVDAAAQTVDGLQNFRGAWASLSGALATPASVSHSGKVWVLAASVADVTAHTPGVSASWINMTPVPATPSLPITVEGGNVTFASAPGDGKIYSAVAMGPRYELALMQGLSSLHAVVWDKTNKVFGSPVLVRTAVLNTSNTVKAVAINTTQTVVVSCPTTTAFEAVCLTISGTTITVGTAATATLAGNLVGLNDIQLIGTSVVVGYQRATSVAGIRALSVSGSTVTIGAESALSGTSTAYLHVVSTSVVLTVSTNGTNVYAKPYTVSGSTLTAGTEASTAGSLIVNTAVLTTGRWFVTYTNTTGYAAVISVSGTTATMSAVSVLSAAIGSAWPVTGGKVLCVNASNANVLTDSAGTAVAGTAVAQYAGIGTNSTTVGFTDTAIYAVASGWGYKLTYSGNEPSLTTLGAHLTPTINGNGVDPKCNLVRALTDGTSSLLTSFSGAALVALCSDADGVSVMSVPSGLTHGSGLVSRTIGYSQTYALSSSTATTYKIIRMELTA